MATFQEGYTRFCNREDISQELRPLLANVYNRIHAAPVDLITLRESLVALLSFLCQPERRTEANCRAVDLFFTIDDHWHARWESLPEDYRTLLDDVGGTLHDAIEFPDIARNFMSAPEQLLHRAERLRT